MSENSLIPSEQELSSYQLIAKKAADSQFFNKIGGEGGLLSMMLYARELRIGPMEAIRWHEQHHGKGRDIPSTHE